jgi:hypothetical protein
VSTFFSLGPKGDSIQIRASDEGKQPLDFFMVVPLRAQLVSEQYFGLSKARKLAMGISSFLACTLLGGGGVKL